MDSTKTPIRELVLATRNADKGRELQAILSDLGIRIRTMAEYPDAPEVVEDGATCRDNALKKALSAQRHTGLPAIADDTGLEVDALGGRPGVFAARYAGEHATYADNCRKLLQELDGVPTEGRGARFVTYAAIAYPDGATEVAHGVLEGRIAEQAQGQGGFGYDPVFYVPTLGRTLAEIAPAEKNRISHRGLAFQQAKNLLQIRSASHPHVGA
ncbi:MAG: XTP/dITP diphosphatase [Nitrospiraceae bacterium]